MGEIKIFDFNRDLRATINIDDGSVKRSDDSLVALVNETGGCGDIDESFLGEINDDGQVINQSDDIVGNMDESKGMMKFPNGSTFALLSSSGEIFDSLDSVRGYIEPFSYSQMRLYAAYFFFLDQALLKVGLSTRIGISPDGYVDHHESYNDQSSARVVPKTSIIIFDDHGIRTEITSDGKVKNIEGEVLGYIKENEALNNNSQSMGSFSNDSISDATGEVIARIDRSESSILDGNYSPLCKIVDGRVVPVENVKGFYYMQNFTQDKWEIYSLYLIFFDLGLIKPGEKTIK